MREHLQLADQPVVPPEFQLHPDARFERGEPFLVELTGPVARRAAVHAGRAVSPPERHRGLQPFHRLLRGAVLLQSAGACDLLGEERGVHVGGVGVQHVPRRPRGDRDLAVRVRQAASSARDGAPAEPFRKP